MIYFDGFKTVKIKICVHVKETNYKLFLNDNF